LAILHYTKSFVVYCLQAPLIFRHQQSCFWTSAALIIQIWSVHGKPVNVI